MPRPRPEQYRTRAEYHWALQRWRKRTGGYLVTTVVLCMITGAALDGTVGMVGLTVMGVCFQLMLRQADGDSQAVWAQLIPSVRRRRDAQLDELERVIAENLSARRKAGAGYDDPVLRKSIEQLMAARPYAPALEELRREAHRE